jgi:hypothetical protein
MSADILPFIIEGHSFDETATQAMGEAYDKARGRLHDKGQPAIVQEIIAKRIIDLATAGERDSDELARRALLALGMTE